MHFEWRFLIEMGIIGLALLLGTLIRSKIKIFQTFLVPNSLTAGLLLFPIYNWVLPKFGIDQMNLKNFVFHLLNISFIAMTLRHTRYRKGSRHSVLSTSTLVLTQYALQCFVGTIITLILIKTIFPGLFPGFGLFATLGFSLGPGQAFAFGSGWDKLGFEGLGSVGLTFGGLGFVWACFGGIFLINYGMRKGWLSQKEMERIQDGTVRYGVLRRGESGKSPINGARNITNPEAIDPLSFSAALVFAIYILSYFALKGISWTLGLIGPAGVNLAINFWGIMFILCGLIAIMVKAILKHIRLEQIIDNNNLTRISGLSVDILVVSSIAAINAVVVGEYWLPILLIAVLAGLATTFSHIWLSSRIFRDHVFYRTILIYGTAIGTLPTGLALLRVIDPQFETPASRDFMLSAGLTFFIAIPILLTANMPAIGALNGSLIPTYQVLGLYGLYLLLCAATYRILSGRRRFKNLTNIWYQQ